MLGHAMTSTRTTTLSRPAAVMPAPVRRDEPVTWLDAKGIRTSVARDDVLFNEGDDARSCYRIVSGAIRVVKIMADGRRYVVDFLLPGDVVGLDGTGSYEFTAEAIIDSELVRYPRPRIDTALEDNPTAGRRLLELTFRRLAAAQSQMLLLGRMNAMERIATFLLALERRQGAGKAGPRTVRLDMTRMDIADHLGLTLETVSRMLNQLKRRGVIELPHPQRICILKPGALQALAAGEC
jgi:CRP/FNR family transcriptional regulator